MHRVLSIGSCSDHSRSSARPAPSLPRRRGQAGNGGFTPGPSWRSSLSNSPSGRIAVRRGLFRVREIMTIKSRMASRRYGTVEEATAALIAACGGIDGAAASCRVGRSQLADYANPHEEKSFMPLDVVQQLEAACGQPIVTEYLAGRHDVVLVKLPTGPTSLRTWMQAEAGVLKEHAERAGKMADALADGRLDLNEAVEVLRETDESLRELAMLREMLRRHIADHTAAAAE